MTPNVYEMFCEQRKIWLSMKKDPDFEVDGYKNFIFYQKQQGEICILLTSGKLYNE